MQTVARFYKIEEAHLFRMLLESEGIGAFVLDEYVPQNYWLYTFAVGGVRVSVADEDVERAVELYRDYEQRVVAAPEVVGDVKAWPIALLATFLVGVPVFLFGRIALTKNDGNT